MSYRELVVGFVAHRPKGRKFAFAALDEDPKTHYYFEAENTIAGYLPEERTVVEFRIVPTNRPNRRDRAVGVRVIG